MNRMTCDPARIELFLDRELSNEEQAAFESHLDQCAECRSRLESAAADDDAWSCVRESLISESAFECSRNSPAPDAAACEADSFGHRAVLKLLAPSDDDRMIGRIGPYEVMGVIGSGGMGVVLKAFDPALNRYVAIKVLAPHLGSSGAARRRFAREAQAFAAVVHENVMEIYGVADIEGLPYLVMPYLRGPSLHKRLDDEGYLATAEVLRIGMQCAQGLAAAHAQGLVHRDIKPANILLADGIERVKLTDFGLARAADDVSLTKTGMIAGTPQYMSPEQARGEPVDQRSDLFSLGCVLYAMCTGREPFRAETCYGILRRITDDEPRPIRELNPDIPDWLCHVITRLMAKQPADRFTSANEVAHILEACLAHVQQPYVVRLPACVEDLPPIGKSNGRKRPHLRFFVAAALALAMIFAGIWVVLELGKGKLIIESEADDIPVRITRGHEIVEELTVTKAGTSIRVAAGRYRVEVPGEFSGLVIENDTVELNRGARQVVRIRYQKADTIPPSRKGLEDRGVIPGRDPVDNGTTSEIEGVVLAVLGEFAEISVGYDDGLRVGQKLVVIHEGMHVGRVEVLEMKADTSVVRIDERDGRTSVRSGQQVVSHPRQSDKDVSKHERTSDAEPEPSPRAVRQRTADSDNADNRPGESRAAPAAFPGARLRSND